MISFRIQIAVRDCHKANGEWNDDHQSPSFRVPDYAALNGLEARFLHTDTFLEQFSKSILTMVSDLPKVLRCNHWPDQRPPS